MILTKPDNNHNANTDPYADIEDNFGEYRLKFEFEPILASELAPSKPVPWLWEGYLAPGHTTLLTGMWKAGKTTMLTHLLKAMQSGGELATRVNPGRVLYISEESETLWSERRDRFAYDDSLHLLIRPFISQPDMTNWIDFIDRVEDHVRKNNIDLVIFDTWSRFNPVTDENDAQKTNAALLPLNRITRTNAAVMLIHHPRKGQGNEFTAARGSGVLSGIVDVIMELRRFNPNSIDDRKRKLTTASRFDDTNTEVVVELTEDGYKLIGSMSEATQEDRLDIIMTILMESGTPMRVDDIKEQWPDDSGVEPSKTRLRKDLEVGHNTHRWDRDGEGVKGDPHVYSLFH